MNMRVPALVLSNLLLAAASVAAAPILNGGFENGVPFAGWSTTGITSIETAAFGSGPTAGAQMARMSSGNGAEVGAVTDAELETFLGLAAGTIDSIVTTNDMIGAREGSAISQSFFANAGDVLSFDWNFLTSELTPISDTNDTAFWTLIPGGPMVLADTFSAFVPSATVLDEETGFQTVNFVIPAAGLYTLGFAVVDVSDTALGSVLLVDNVRLVPEPGLLALVGLGAVAAAVRRRQRASTR
jgi:hypothetical protein